MESVPDIRDISEVELEGVAAAFVEIFNQPPWNDEWTDTTAQQRLREIRDAPGGLGFVAIAEGSVCGFVLGRLEQWDSGKLYYLQEMGITPAQQRHGIGTELLDSLTNELQTRDVERMYLLTMEESPAAAFYDSNGFDIDESTQLQYLHL